MEESSGSNQAEGREHQPGGRRRGAFAVPHRGAKWLTNGSGGVIEVLGPPDGKRIASVLAGGAEEVDEAVDAAWGSFDMRSSLLPEGRAEHLRRLADLIDGHTEEIAKVESLDGRQARR